MTGDASSMQDAASAGEQAPVASASESAGDMAWNGMFRQLAQYKAVHGHCFVPLRCQENPKLGAWLAEQAGHFHKHRLSPERQQALEELGFLWDFAEPGTSKSRADDLRWEQRFAELVAFKELHGHLHITLKNQISPGLMHWQDNQRIKFRAGTMTPERKARLEAVGFLWEAPGRLAVGADVNNEAAWERMFTQLVQYKEAHGHCRVPSSWKENPQLAKWVRRQRLKHRRGDKHGHLRPDRKARLDEVGFQWEFDGNHNPLGWDGRFAELVAFKERHGHLHITKTNQLSPGLMHWRDNQRINHRAGRMTPERKAQLEAIGFEWELPGRLAGSAAEQNEAAWERMFTQLVQYKEAHGHCLVPSDWKEDPQLGKWVGRQRLKHRRGDKHGHLRPDRKARLDAIGFQWQHDGQHNPLGWDGRFAELVTFKELHGHLHITKTNQLSAGLQHWLDNQRLNLREGRLTPERKARLDALDVGWQRPGSPALQPTDGLALWDRLYERLQDFKRQHGHIDDSVLTTESSLLAHWVRRQRIAREGGGLTPGQIARLDALGFSWLTDSEAHWLERFSQLEAFHAEHGHTRVPKGGQLASLCEWRKRQRAHFRSGQMNAGHLARLDALDAGWAANPQHDVAALGKNWEARFAQLTAFHAEHGHCHPSRTDVMTRSLAEWVRDQRRKLRAGKLTAERIGKLDSLGWQQARPASVRPVRVRTPSALAVWDERFEQLADFMRTHGHSRVPKARPELKRLFSWVVAQRVYQRKGTLRPECKERLDALGFDWNPSATPRPRVSAPRRSVSMLWERLFQQLFDFKERHGHTRVSANRGEDKTLGGWCVRQRHHYRKGTLNEERVRRLEEIGFVWHPQGRVFPGTGQPSASQHDTWEARFAEFTAYCEEHGHALVTTKHAANPRLGNWVSNTRLARKRGQLSDERIARLDALGFVWVNGRSASINLAFWERRYAELLDFKEQHGHPNVPSTYEANRGLAAWVATQRARQRRGRISEEQKAKLDALGLKWFAQRIAPKNRSWAQRLADLTAYKQRYGHPHVSKGDVGYQRLNTWVKAQRIHRMHGELAQDKIDQLNAIGFAWDGMDGVWERNLVQWQRTVRGYPIRHIPLSEREHHALAQWEARQRHLHDKGQLSPARLSQLIDASFLWDVPPDMPDGSPRPRFRRDTRTHRPPRQRPPKKSAATRN